MSAHELAMDMSRKFRAASAQAKSFWHGLSVVQQLEDTQDGGGFLDAPLTD